MIRVSDYVAKRLKEFYGVKDVFLIVGGGAMYLNNSFAHYFRCICNHNEQASAIAAEGYARYGQKLAVVNVTTGPGGLNAVGGLLGCWTDSAPVLFISGQVKSSTSMASYPDFPLRQLGDQEADIISVVKPLVKYCATVREPNMIKYYLDMLAHLATNGRFAPVWLDIPLDVQSAYIDEKELEEFYTTKDYPEIYELQIEKVIDKLKNAKRPLIVVGHGVRLASAKKELMKFLDLYQAPVVTTFNGMDLVLDTHPSYIGRIGTIGQRAGNFALQSSDCVLFLGTRNNIRQISYNWENFAKQAFKIIVDIDNIELVKPTIKGDLLVNADAKPFLEDLSKHIKPQIFSEWLSWCKERKERYSFENTPEYQHQKEINPYKFTRQLSEALKPNDVIVTGNASATICLFQTAIVKEDQRYIFNSGSAAMGYDLPVAIGASLASKKRTICLTGDGSIMMNIQELQTICHHKLPIKIFLLNNGGYISIRQTQDNFFNGEHVGSDLDSGISFPDFVKVAEAFNIPAFRITDPNECQITIEKVLAMDGPVFCEVCTDKNYIFLPKLSSRTLDDGTIVSPSLEDMYPFLSKAELEQNIIKD